jgi:hypothetical protein
MMLNSAIMNAMNSAHQGDYLNAVIEMRAAASVTDLKLPAEPYGIPDIRFGRVWQAYRWYYKQNFPTVFAHVNAILKKLSRGMIEVGNDEDDE